MTRIDERSLGALIEESQDLQTDALRDSKAALADLADLRADRRGEVPDPAAVKEFDASRRELLGRFGLSGKSWAGKALFGGGIGAAITSILATPASAQESLDIQILNTASSLENLAVATYEAALGLDFIKNGNKVIVAFAQTTQKQHADHGAAFNAQAKALGGKEQKSANPTYAAVVEKAKAGLTSPLAVVNLAATLEEVASDTYLDNLTRFTDKRSKEIMGSVLGVEVQHLAILNAVRALIEADAAEFIAIPTNLAKLPAPAGSVGFPDGAFLKASPETIAPAESGAVK